MQVVRWIPLAAALGLTLVTGACGGDSGTGPGGGGGLSGEYHLEWVNEDGLPEDEPMNWGTASFTGGALRMGQDGTWEMRIDYGIPEANQSLTAHDNGEFERDGSDLYFRSHVYDDEFDGEVDEDAVMMEYDFDGDGNYETVFTFER